MIIPFQSYLQLHSCYIIIIIIIKFFKETRSIEEKEITIFFRKEISSPPQRNPQRSPPCQKERRKKGRKISKRFVKRPAINPASPEKGVVH